MAKVIKGVVTWAGDEKKYGNYSFKLKDNDGWFRSPKRCADVIQPGYTVKVKVDKDDRGDFTVTSKPKLVEKGKPPAKGGGGGRRGGYKPDPEKEKRIVIQHSQEMAIRATECLLANNAVKLAKTKVETNYTVIMDLIDELTAKFFADGFKPENITERNSGDEEPDEEDEEDFDEDSDGDDDDDPDWDDD